MLRGASSLSPAEEAAIKSLIRAQEKYAEYTEAFNEIDELLLTTKREGLIKDVHVLSLYNTCNREIDTAKKAAIRAKQPAGEIEQPAAPSENFAFRNLGPSALAPSETVDPGNLATPSIELDTKKR